MKATIFLAGALLLLPTAVLAEKQLYRWVDSQGKVHYGDTLPPESARQGKAELTKSGRVVKETPPALTPEQIRAREEAEAREREARRVAEEQRRRDKALLSSYTSVGELDLAERRNLEAVDVRIKSLELRARSVRHRLDALKKREAAMTARGRPVPEDLSEGQRAAEEELKRLAQSIAEANAEKEAIRARFSADRARYIELKGIAPESAKP
jgi:hypothetical protein